MSDDDELVTEGLIELRAKRERQRPALKAIEGALDKYSIAIVGGHSRVVCWEGTTLQFIHVSAFGQKVELNLRCARHVGPGQSQPSA